jgi:hypothetical protein
LEAKNKKLKEKNNLSSNKADASSSSSSMKAPSPGAFTPSPDAFKWLQKAKQVVKERMKLEPPTPAGIDPEEYLRQPSKKSTAEPLLNKPSLPVNDGPNVSQKDRMAKFHPASKKSTAEPLLNKPSLPVNDGPNVSQKDRMAKSHPASKKSTAEPLLNKPSLPVNGPTSDLDNSLVKKKSSKLKKLALGIKKFFTAIGTWIKNLWNKIFNKKHN